MVSVLAMACLWGHWPPVLWGWVERGLHRRRRQSKPTDVAICLLPILAILPTLLAFLKTAAALNSLKNRQLLRPPTTFKRTEMLIPPIRRYIIRRLCFCISTLEGNVGQNGERDHNLRHAGEQICLRASSTNHPFSTMTWRDCSHSRETWFSPRS
jgi:hypothetical protein